MSQPSLAGLTTYQPSQRAQIVQALADFRREWQQTAQGKSLLDVEVPIGLLLSDIADRLELSPQERYAMLGGKLINQVDCFLESRLVITAE